MTKMNLDLELYVLGWINRGGELYINVSGRDMDSPDLQPSVEFDMKDLIDEYVEFYGEDYEKLLELQGYFDGFSEYVGEALTSAESEKFGADD
jgi:hypothetical protein